jgi:hypothetical protein
MTLNGGNSALKDTRYVYGFCTWHNTIDKVGMSGSLPCCPKCGSMLMELPNEDSWWINVREFDKTHPGYLELIKWGQGKCFPNLIDLIEAYNKSTGSNFEMP